MSTDITTVESPETHIQRLNLELLVARELLCQLV